MTNLDIFNPTKVRGLFEALTTERDKLADTLFAAQSALLTEGMRADTLAAKVASMDGELNQAADESAIKAARIEMLEAELAHWKDCHGVTGDHLVVAKRRIATLEAALPHVLDFRLESVFDAKGTYTQAKADEWSKRLADFAAALPPRTGGEMSEWQPIDTAPALVEGLFYIRPRKAEEQWVIDGEKPVDLREPPRIVFGRNRAAWSSLWIATHWMPLPAPPVDGEVKP
jgi:hypothetical protein